MNRDNQLMTRRGVLLAFAATAITAAPSYAKASGFLRGAGDVRVFNMKSGRTGEKVNMIYWIDGAYIPESLSEINYFMRDWRKNKQIHIDTRTVDIIAACHRLMDTTTPFNLLSGYRTAQTNAMLSEKSGGVAVKSYHIKGQAADLTMSDRSVKQIAKAASYCRAGGVGKYSRSHFVHVDCGPLRVWGR